jgi:hypothetical protein
MPELEEKAADTEVKKNTGAAKKAPVVEMSDSPTMTAEDLAEARKAQKDACAKEVSSVLEKYGCDFSARVVVTEEGNFPQVFIIDARQRG